MDGMSLQIRPAHIGDVPTLVALMQAFYAEAGFSLSHGPAARAFETLLADPRLGGVWVAEEAGVAVGHLAMTVCFSMEYGGSRGFIDDLYVRPSMRGRGVGRDLLAAARANAVARGIRALHVEVGPDNQIARGLYARAGYADTGHLLLSLPLDTPVHDT